MSKKHFFLSVIVTCMLPFAIHAQTLPQAIAMIDGEDYKDAKNAITKLIAADAANPELYYWNGVAKLGLEEWASAKEDFKAGIKLKPKYPYNHIGLGRVLQHEGNAKDAQLEYEKAKEYNTKTYDANVDITLGYAYLEAGKSKYDDAEVVFTRAQTKDSKNPKSYIALGDYYRSRGVEGLPTTQYKQAIALDPKFVEGYYRLGRVEIFKAEKLEYRRDREEDEAKKAKLTEEMKAAYQQGIEYYSKAIEYHPDFSPAYRDRAELYFRYNKWVEAAKDYEKYVALQKKDYRAQIRYASFLFLTKEYKKAVQMMEETRKDTTTSVMLRLLGYCNYEMGNAKKGLEYMDEYFKSIKPEYILMDDYAYQGKMYHALKDVPTAVNNFEKAMDKDSTQWRLMNIVVDSLAAQRIRDTSAQNKIKYATEEAKYRKLMLERKKKHIATPNGADYYTLGYTYYSANDYENAQKVFTDLLSMNEGFYQIYAYYWIAKSLKDNKEKRNDAYDKLLAAYDKKASPDKKEKEYALTACLSLISWKADPEGKGIKEELNCAAAAPYIVKGLSIDATNKTIATWIELCPPSEAPAPTPKVEEIKDK